MQNDKSKLTDNVDISAIKKMMEEMSFKENLNVKHYDGEGNLIGETDLHNTVTTGGKNGAADQLLASPTLGKPTHMAIGTGSPASTLLGTEVARVSFDSKTRSGAVVTMVATFGAGVGTGTITEAGIFDNGTANTVNMWNSATSFTHTKGASDSLVFTWTITFA
jgi:hypothetical protein